VLSPVGGVHIRGFKQQGPATTCGRGCIRINRAQCSMCRVQLEGFTSEGSNSRGSHQRVQTAGVHIRGFKQQGFTSEASNSRGSHQRLQTAGSCSCVWQGVVHSKPAVYRAVCVLTVQTRRRCQSASAVLEWRTQCAGEGPSTVTHCACLSQLRFILATTAFHISVFRTAGSCNCICQGVVHQNQLCAGPYV
jgi:hypothetical protein